MYDVKNYVHIIIDSPQLKLYIYNEEKKSQLKLHKTSYVFVK